METIKKTAEAAGIVGFKQCFWRDTRGLRELYCLSDSSQDWVRFGHAGCLQTDEVIFIQHRFLLRNRRDHLKMGHQSFAPNGDRVIRIDQYLPAWAIGTGLRTCVQPGTYGVVQESTVNGVTYVELDNGSRIESARLGPSTFDR